MIPIADFCLQMRQTEIKVELYFTTKAKFNKRKYLHECINVELRTEGKTCKFLSLYRSSTQNRDEFEKFSENLELSIDHMADKNPYMMIILADFNAKLNSLYANDNTT